MKTPLSSTNMPQDDAISKQFWLSIALVFLSVVFVLKWFKRKANNNQSYKLPPSPPFRLPIIGNLHQLGFLPHRTLALLAQRYGSLMLLHLGNQRALVASSASAAQEILKTHDICFSNRPPFRVFQKFCCGGADVVTAPYGESWRYLRSLLVQQVLNPKRVKTFRSIREEETYQVIKKIEEESLSGNPFDLSQLLHSLPVTLMCRAAFGKNYTEEGSSSMKFKDLALEFLIPVGTFDVEEHIPWLSWLNNITGRNRRVDSVIQSMDLIFENILKDHINDACGGARSEDQMDVVDVLLEIQKNKSNLESHNGDISLSTENIKGLIMDMIFAGTDTISTTLEWAMTELMRHPEIMKKAQKEIRSIDMQSRQWVNEDDTNKMDYLKAVIKETYRLHPAIPLIPRESIEQVNLQGYDIPSKTRVTVNAWAIGRDPRSWDNPEVFDPERFLRGDSAASVRDFKGMSFELIPFGAGRRGCPGISYASPLIELALASLLHKFDWSLPGDMKVEDLDMSESFGITVSKKHPLNVVATTTTTN